VVKKKAEEEAAAAKKKAEEEAAAAKKKAEDEELAKFLFAGQLAQLVEMGFTDLPKNRELLLRHNGNVDQVLEALFLV